MIQRSLALPILIAACHDQRALPAPSNDPKTIGVLMLALEGGELQSATAFDLTDGHGYPSIRWRGDVELIALEYSCSVLRLGLVPGAQELLDQPTDDERLPPPRRMTSTGIDAPEWKPAEMTDAISSAIRRLNLEADNICTSARARYVTKSVGVPADDHDAPSFLILYDGETALVGSTDGKVYRVSREGAIDRVSALEDRQYRGAYRSPRGELWMMSDRGVLASGTIDGLDSVTSTDAFLDPRRGIAIAGPKDIDAPFELFITATNSSTRAFVRFDGVGWEMISSTRPHDSIFLPAAVWIEPEHAIAIGVGRYRNSVVRYRGGIITEELLPSDAGPSAILQHPTLGTIVGMDDGTIARHAGTGQWEALPSPPKLRYVRTASPIGEGFIFGGSAQVNFISYRFGQYFPAIGFCDAESLTPEEIAVSHLAAFADRALIGATLQSFDSPLGIVILELEEEAGTCSQQ